MSPAARSNCPGVERGVERGERVGERPTGLIVLGLIENRDVFIKFSFVWV